MSKTIQDVITILEKWAPTYYAEDFDNVGLLVGNKKDAVTGNFGHTRCFGGNY